MTNGATNISGPPTRNEDCFRYKYSIAITSSQQQSRPIWDAFLNHEFELIITPSILLEYEEIIAQKTSPQVSTNVVALLEEAVNTVLIHIYYEWNVMTNDPDDNKFFEASAAGNANYLVTNDEHFKQALAIAFPKINVIDAVQFLGLLGKSTN